MNTLANTGRMIKARFGRSKENVADNASDTDSIRGGDNAGDNNQASNKTDNKNASKEKGNNNNNNNNDNDDFVMSGKVKKNRDQLDQKKVLDFQVYHIIYHFHRLENIFFF